MRGSLALALGLALIGPAQAQERASEKAPAEKPAEKKPAVAIGAGAEGFTVQSEGGDYKLAIRGYVHFDGRFFPGDDEKLATDQFLLRRVRPIVEGTLARNFEFRVMPDFGGGTTVLQEAYLDVKYTPRFQVRAGKFKSPVGLERLQAANWISFAERAFPTNLLPNRDLGLQVSGELAGGVLAYAAGVFDGAPDGGLVDLDASDGKDLAGRVFLQPFKKGKSALKGLGFGIAGTTGEQTAGSLSAYRSPGQVNVVSVLTGVTADGTRTRLAPQFSFYRGRLGLLGEWARSRHAVKKAASGATPESRAHLTARAWQVSTVVTLTGEDATFSGVKPKAPFDPARKQWGALQLALRAHGFEIGDEAVTARLVDPARSVREALAWSVGLNWYLNRHVKQVLDFERTTFTAGAAAGADRPAENAIFIRSQVSF